METTIELGKMTLRADLEVPARAIRLILFAHGAGSSRRSPRDQHVAYRLRERGFATLLFDLASDEETQREAPDAPQRYDLDLMAHRLISATDWVALDPGLAAMPLGYFGSSTGAAVAMIAAALRPGAVRAVVCRGGRPDLAGELLHHGRAPTLFVVGGEDAHVLELNRAAQRQVVQPNRLEVLPGVGHLFEEPGALDELSRLAGDWFMTWLERTPPAPRRAQGDAIC